MQFQQEYYFTVYGTFSRSFLLSNIHHTTNQEIFPKNFIASPQDADNIKKGLFRYPKGIECYCRELTKDEYLIFNNWVYNALQTKINEKTYQLP